MQQILVIEDDKRMADYVSHCLGEEGYQTWVAYDGAMGLRLFQSHRFDLVVSAIVLPKLHGFDLCRAIRALSAEVPVLLLTSLNTITDKLDGFAAGADDYMTKPFDMRELLARVRALLRRRPTVAAAVAVPLVYGDVRIDRARREVWRQEQRIALTLREYQLLLYLVEHAERVVSRIELAEQVWHTPFDTGTNFIDVYISYLRRKIDKPFAVKLIHTKPGVGFLLSDRP